jgi:hypothetical protein
VKRGAGPKLGIKGVDGDDGKTEKKAEDSGTANKKEFLGLLRGSCLCFFAANNSGAIQVLSLLCTSELQTTRGITKKHACFERERESFFSI